MLYYSYLKEVSANQFNDRPQAGKETNMKYEIVYTTNEELWKMEKIAEFHGYKKTQECYWVQIFEDTNGNHIVMTREDGELLFNPCDRLEAMLKETASKEAQEAAEEAQKESPLDKVASELEARKDRSAWSKGVTVYALELVEELKERAAYEGRNPEPGAECREWMLNGAQDWAQYSWGGSSLIYDCDIAERLCTPSELKKTRNGERRPNSREEWLDTQARALYQACNRVSRLYRSIILTPGTIYAAALAALPACDIDHNASDLYLKRTPAAVALVERLNNKALLSVFRDPDGVAWYDLPFCFSPYWENPGKYW